MRMRAVCILALLLVLGAGAWAEIELGVGLTPAGGDEESEKESNFWEDSFKTVHLGWRTLGVLYFSGDFMVVPPFIAKGMTSYWDDDRETWVEGIYRPAVVSIYDVGLKLKLGSFSFLAQMGINQFYIYKQDELENFDPPEIGANIKLGVGLRLVKFLGIEVTAISIQPSFKDAVDVIGGVFDSDEELRNDAVDKLVDQIVPSLQLVLYL